MLVESVQTGVEALIGGLADGTVDRVDGDDFFDLPDYGWDTAND
ncbi:hypothetical protein [Micromonospora sp. NPDC048830]